MSEAPNNEPFEALLCSECFEDHGLSLDGHSLGLKTDARCPHCGSPTGRKLDRDSLLALADTFFVRGTLVRAEYGAAPVLQFNEYHHRKTEIDVNERLLGDFSLVTVRRCDRERGWLQEFAANYVRRFRHWFAQS